jgi:hypothetical protein
VFASQRKSEWIVASLGGFGVECREPSEHICNTLLALLAWRDAIVPSGEVHEWQQRGSYG